MKSLALGFLGGILSVALLGAVSQNKTLRTDYLFVDKALVVGSDDGSQIGLSCEGVGAVISIVEGDKRPFFLLHDPEKKQVTFSLHSPSEQSGITSQVNNQTATTYWTDSKTGKIRYGILVGKGAVLAKEILP